MKYLITGGAGFIGSHLCELLLKLGHQVCVIDNFLTGRSESIRELLANKNFKLIEADLAACANLNSVVANCDAVFHLAASVGVENIINHPLSSLKNSLGATEAVLLAAASNHKPILFTSSSEVYGLNKETPFAETDQVILGSPHKARWAYATEKLLSEHLALAYFKEQQLPVIVVRLFNTIGPRQSAKYGMVVPRFISQARANKPLTIYGNGSQQRCFTSVYDVVDALHTLMQTKEAHGKIINVGNSKQTTISDLADLIIALTKSHSTKKYIPISELHQDFAEMPYRKPSLKLIKKLINFQPNTNLKMLLTQIIAYESQES